MAVLIEAISVVIKRSSIEKKFPGGWDAFVQEVPNQTLCTDGNLVRVGFMTPDDVRHYVKSLESNGVFYLKNGEACDLVVADMLKGIPEKCDWAKYSDVPFGDDNLRKIGICQGVEDDDETIFFPDDWEFENSISYRGSSAFIPNEEIEERIDFLKKTENGINVYLDKKTGEEIFISEIDELKIMTSQEIHDFGIQIASGLLEDEGYEIQSVNKELGLNPQIIAKKENHSAYIAIRTGCYPGEGQLEESDHSKMKELAELVGAVPFFGSVGIANSDSKTEEGMGIPVKGAGFNAKWSGLKKIS